MTESQPPRSPWANHFHLIIPRLTPNATAAAMLMQRSPQGWQLPYVHTEGFWHAETSKVIAALRQTLNLNFDFTVLRYATFEGNEEERWDRMLLVLEPSHPLNTPPLDGEWVERTSLQTLPLALPDQRVPLLRYLEESEQGDHSPLLDPRRAPWARLGWFAAASAWIAEAIAALGHTQTGPVEQLRNWSISSVLVAPTSAGRFYFKAAAALPLFVNEPALTQTLAELYPGHVPTPLKIDHEKRWMLMEDFGATAHSAGSSDESGDGNEDKNKDKNENGNRTIDYTAIYAAYGKLQRESARHLDELMAAGCINRSLEVLASQIDPLVTDPVTHSALTPQEAEALTTLVPQLKARCAQVAAYNIPATLLHGDLHPGNITQRNGDYIFFDWTDAAIGFPFLDHFLLYFELDDEADYLTWRDTYLQAWRDYESPARLREAWELAKPLCALHHAVSYLTIAKNIEPLTGEELFHGLPDNLRRLLAAMRA